MTLLAIGPAWGKTPSARDGCDLIRAPGLTRRCTPPEKVLADCLTSCEQLADRVAALEKTWGAIVGSELFLAAWAVLHGLAQVSRNRTCDRQR